MNHPLYQFIYCPICGQKTFKERNEKAKSCESCGFVYYFNPSAAVACFIRNEQGDILIAKRGKEPAIGTLDLPGGFVDMHETGEEAALREIKEETGLVMDSCQYVFSLPNIYPYAGFNVHTLDLYYECTVRSFDGATPHDDVSDLYTYSLDELNPKDFGLQSIQKAVELYVNRQYLAMLKKN